MMSIFSELLSPLDCHGPVCYDRFLAALTAGVPVTVFYRFERSKLALAWREWMTKRVLEVMEGVSNRTSCLPSYL